MSSPLHTVMTFNEADVNREADGKFGHKTGTPANVQLLESDESGDYTMSEAVEENLTAIARKFAPNSNLTPVIVKADPGAGQRSGYGLQETNGDVHYTFQFDEHGNPTQLNIDGKRQRYDSAQYRAMEDAPDNGLSAAYLGEHWREMRHVEREISLAEHDGLINREYDGVEGKTRVTEGVIGQTPDGADISLTFEVVEATEDRETPTGTIGYRQVATATINIAGKHNVEGIEAIDYLYGSTGKNGEDLSGLAESLTRIESTGYTSGTPAQELFKMKMQAHLGRELTLGESLAHIPKDEETGYEYGTGYHFTQTRADDIADVYEAFRDKKWQHR